MSVLTILDHVGLESLFLAQNNITKIQHLSNTGEVLATYTDCICLKRLSKEIGAYTDGDIDKDVYTIELSTDVNLAVLKAVQRENSELKEQVTTLTETVDLLVLSKLETEA